MSPCLICVELMYAEVRLHDMEGGVPDHLQADSSLPSCTCMLLQLCEGGGGGMYDLGSSP